MTQRNPMNERYQDENRGGVTRKSAASAKPKSKAASSVTVQTAKKTPQQKKQARKDEEKISREKQRELDRKYYTPDTERYKKLRRTWWIVLGVAVVMVIVAWFAREIEPAWISFVALILAYGFIIYAFYLDFSKIRKERIAYQKRMAELELAQEKKKKQAQRKNGKKGADAGATEAGSGASDANAGSEGPIKKESKGFLGLFKK